MSSDTRVVTRSPEILSGTPVFAGTRVPVRTFIDYLEAGIAWRSSFRIFQACRRSKPLPLFT